MQRCSIRPDHSWNATRPGAELSCNLRDFAVAMVVASSTGVGRWTLNPVGESMSSMEPAEGANNDQDAASCSAAHGVACETRSAPRTGSWVQRLLDNKTGLQRAVISLGALITAALAIGGAVAAIVRMIDNDESARDLEAAPGDTVRIDSGTDAANHFVHVLDEHDGGVVTLDHQIVAEKGPADVRLQYDCTDSGVCVMVRVQDVDVVATDMRDGLWFSGCFAITRDGAGYGYEPLDMELRYQGETCP